MKSSDKPGPVNLNLDTIEREIDEQPFVFVHKGVRFEMVHPATLDAFEFLNVIGQGEPHATIDTLKLALGPKDFEAFKAGHPRFKAMQQLVADYFDYAGVNQGN